MAEKLSIQIALEGGAEITRQLEGIGQAGQKAFSEIAKAAEKVGGFKNLDPQAVTQMLQQLGITGAEAVNKIQAAVQQAGKLEKFASGVQTLENAFTKLGIVGPDALKKITSALQEAGQLENVVAGVQKVQAAFGAFGRALPAIGLAAVALGKQIHDGMTSAAAAIGEVNTAAIKLGTTIEKFDQIRLGFEQAGVSAKGFAEGMARVQSVFDNLQADKIKAIADRLAAGDDITARGVQILQEAAQGFGQAAALARAELEKLGIPIPDSAAESIRRLGMESKDAASFARDLALKLAEMAPGAERDALAMQFFGAELVRALNTGGIAMDQFIAKNATLTQAGVQSADELVAAQNRVITSWQRFSTDPSLASFGDLVKNVFKEIGIEIEQATKPLVEFSNKLDAAVWGAIKDAGVAAWEAIGKAMDDWVVKPVQALFDWIDKLIAKLKELLGLGQEVGSGSGSDPVTAPQGFAGGGRVGGRGSGTSDSNLAWVSRGEHIMPARAVRQPGVLAFLEALRRSGGNLSRVLDGMGRFALGGMVPRSIPAFAGGGLVGGMSNVTIQFPGLDPIGGLRAPSGVVDELRKAAAMAQVRSGGRKPSRYS